jgi:hypothetical protein
MTTPTDDERVGTVMREMLSTGAARPPSMTPDELRRLAQRRTLRRVDTKVLVALAAVAAVIVTLIVVGPLRSTNRPGHSSVATQPSTTTTTPTTTTTVPGDETNQIVYDPFTATGAVSPSLHVTATMSAKTCFASGVAGNSSYRCFSGNGIYDPCFAAPGATSGPLLCPSDPASPDVVELTMSALPPPVAGAPEQRAWAVQLADGQVCVLIDAAWGGLGPLGCGPTPPGPVADCREPVMGPASWTTTCQDQDTDASPFTAATVVIVWF